ncbi:MAG: Radical domain protein [Pedosphaera sp.]|nr:Radical domain protein [Pedosphaera sp.]
MSFPANSSFRNFLASGGFFQGYVYAYPHKTAYRDLNPNRELRAVWKNENKQSLFLYVHVPFCEMRCGFCNLFTTTHPGTGLVGRYLDAIRRQAEAVADALGADARFTRFAMGGGTPTFLATSELEHLFGILNRHFLGAENYPPKAIEASPSTVDEEKLAFFKAQRITRVSLGVQSFIETEVKALGRAQRASDVRQALGRLISSKFDCVNIDLIYGIEKQTSTTWKRSLEEALTFHPQEIYLYPLYVRPLTRLDLIGATPTDDRIELYRIGRDFLLERGYRQISMRLFRSASYCPPEGPVYCCQEDGMVGLGPGARSYTSALHYSSEYAVGRPGIMDVIADFNTRTHEQFSVADYGCELDVGEQKRRYLLKSLLRSDGLDLEDYRAFFTSDAIYDFPQLNELLDDGLAQEHDGALKLNGRGLELSDVIGPWIWSSSMRERMETFKLA